MIASSGQLHGGKLQHHPAHERRSLRFANSCKMMSIHNKPCIMPAHPGASANITLLDTCLLGCRSHSDTCNIGLLGEHRILTVSTICKLISHVSTCRKGDVAAFRRATIIRPEPADTSVSRIAFREVPQERLLVTQELCKAEQPGYAMYLIRSHKRRSASILWRAV